MLRRLMIAAQSNPASGSDDFESDTSGLYTLTQDSGAPSFAISGGVLVINSPAGCQASVTRNAVTVLNGFIEADSDTAQDAGLLFRFIDQNNFYLLAFKDDTSAAGTDNLVIYKRVGGVFSIIGTYNPVWPRGTLATIRLSIVGSAIKAFFNGVQVISVIDPGISSGGKLGMRGNGPPGGTTNNKFLAVRWG